MDDGRAPWRGDHPATTVSAVPPAARRWTCTELGVQRAYGLGCVGRRLSGGLAQMANVGRRGACMLRCLEDWGGLRTGERGGRGMRVSVGAAGCRPAI